MSEQETAPVEVTTRYVTSVDSLPDAWAFVIDRIDRVGPSPSIKISPVWQVSVHDMDAPEGTDWPRIFEVVVEGMVKEGGTA